MKDRVDKEELCGTLTRDGVGCPLLNTVVVGRTEHQRGKFCGLKIGELFWIVRWSKMWTKRFFSEKWPQRTTGNPGARFILARGFYFKSLKRQSYGRVSEKKNPLKKRNYCEGNYWWARCLLGEVEGRLWAVGKLTPLKTVMQIGDSKLFATGLGISNDLLYPGGPKGL